MQKGMIASALVCALLATCALTGCVNSGQTRKLVVSGSNTVLPIGQACAEAFMDGHWDADIQVSGPGSSVGITSIGEGTADIAMSSREAKPAELSSYPSLTKYTIAYDGIPIIVHPSNKVKSLTMAQLRGIYNGTLRNWKDLGGADMKIVVYSRDSASGTREFFHEFVMHNDDFVQPLYEKNSHAAIKQAIAQTPGAIGYVGLGYVDSSVKALAIDNATSGEPANAIVPSLATIKDGSYPISRGLYFYTMGNATGLAKEFIVYVLSSEGQDIVEEEGFVKVL